MADTVSLSSTTQRDLILAFQTALQDFDGIKVNTLIQQGLDVRHLCTDAPKYYTALHELVINFTSHPLQTRPGKLLAKFTDVLTVLLENGVKVNDRDRRYQNQTALHLAAGVPGQQDTIAALIRVGARAGDPDSGQQTALHKAAISGSVENVVVLIDNGADPNVLDNFGHSPLHMAVKRRNSLDLIKTLISKGAAVNQNHPDWNRQSRGGTPLHVAARLGRTENALTLLENGAQPNVFDSTGQTALHIAAGHDLTGKLCSELLQRGAKVNEADEIYGETALQKAVKANMADNVRVLINYEADINKQDLAGNTALHKAASVVQHFDILHMLLSRGGKLNVTNKDGRTPTDFVNDAKNNTAKALFRAHLAPES